MLRGKLQVVARFRAKPGQEAALRAVLASLIAPTLAEPGCYQYDLIQHAQDPAEFVFIEDWEDDAALDAHLQTAHVQSGLARGTPLVAAPPELHRYRPGAD